LGWALGLSSSGIGQIPGWDETFLVIFVVNSKHLLILKNYIIVALTSSYIITSH
jgi:hypothetical protein